MPTVKQLLEEARSKLAETETSSLDARLLLQQASGLSHADFVADPEAKISADVVEQFEALVARRMAYEPVSRILGQREFYGRVFHLTPDVLDPRADTETVVDTCLKYRPQRILDLGTGSGILAITLLAELTEAKGVAVDVSASALAVAKRNAAIHGVAERLHFIEGSWFSNVKDRFDLIVSNPPYIPAGDIAGLEVEVKNYDPHLALAGGKDGLTCYLAIAEHALAYLEPEGLVALEIGAGQLNEVTEIFAQARFELVEKAEDLGGHVRCLVFRFATK